MGLIFLTSWFAQSLAGWATFNETRLQRMQDTVSWGSYLANADFWSRTLQNWQSEFLAVGSMAVLSIYLRVVGFPARSAWSTEPRAALALRSPGAP